MHCFPLHSHESEFFKALAAETVKLLEASFQVRLLSPGGPLLCVGMLTL